MRRRFGRRVRTTAAALPGAEVGARRPGGAPAGAAAHGPPDPGLHLASPRFLAAALALAAATGLADLSLAPGTAGGMLHVALVLLGWWLARPAHVLVLGALASAMVVAGYLLGAVQPWAQADLTNRALALLAIWGFAAALAAAKRREARLRARQAAAAARGEELAAEAAVLRARIAAAGGADSAVLSTIGHELRTPLNAIIGFSEVATSELFGPLGNERYRGYMRDINVSGHRLLRQIEHVLEVAALAMDRERPGADAAQGAPERAAAERDRPSATEDRSGPSGPAAAVRAARAPACD